MSFNDLWACSSVPFSLVCTETFNSFALDFSVRCEGAEKFAEVSAAELKLYRSATSLDTIF